MRRRRVAALTLTGLSCHLKAVAGDVVLVHLTRTVASQPRIDLALHYVVYESSMSHSDSVSKNLRWSGVDQRGSAQVALGALLQPEDCRAHEHAA